MARDFVYKKRTAEDYEKQAAALSNDFPSIVKDGFASYKMRKGENWIRILPNTWHAKDRKYSYKAFLHYGIGPDKATILCPNKMENKKCPVCEAYSRLKASGDDEAAKEISPRHRELMMVIDMKDVEKGPLVMDMPTGLAEDILKIQKDRRTGQWLDIDDPDKGYDVFFDKEGEKILTKYKGAALAREMTRVADAHLNAVVDIPLTERLRWRSAAEIEGLFSGGMDQEEELPPARSSRARPRDEVDEDEIPFEQPTRRRAVVEEEPEEEAPPPRRVRARQPEPEPEEEDEPAPPPRRTRAREAVEEEPEPEPTRRPVGRRPAAVEEPEDEEVAPRPRSRVREPVEEEEAAPAPRRRARVEPEEELEEEPAPRTALRARLAARRA